MSRIPIPGWTADRPLDCRPPDPDANFVNLWLHGRSPATTRAYRADYARFAMAVPKPLVQVGLGDLQAFADGLGGAPASRIRVLSSIKSLFAFAHRIGYLQFDIGAALLLPPRMEPLSSRIMSEAEMHRILAVPASPRDHALVLVLYASGARLAEVCSLRWVDCIVRENGGQLTLYGKGGKTRSVRIPQSAWAALEALKPDLVLDEGYCFGGITPPDPSTLHRVVKRIVEAAGLPNVSAHWLRHAHASHAIDRGAPVSLIQATLGHASLATTGKYLNCRPAESSGRFLGL